MLLGHQMDHLVNEGFVSPEEASTFDEEAFDEKLKELFDPKFSQHFYKADKIEPLKGGQIAERAVIEFFTDFFQEKFPMVKVEHGTMFEDHGRIKSDLKFKVGDLERPVLVQVTTRVDEGVQSKFEVLPPETVPAIMAPVGAILGAQERGNKLDQAGIMKDIFRQVLRGMAERPQFYKRHYEVLMGSI